MYAELQNRLEEYRKGGEHELREDTSMLALGRLEEDQSVRLARAK